MFPGMKPHVITMMVWAAAGLLCALVPPHPRYETVPAAYQPTRIELSAPSLGLSRPKTIPNNILVLRVQFSDLSFQAAPAYPDHLAHDAAFFDRWMLHLSDFFADASHYQYELEYTLYPEVFTLPRPLAYYGGDTTDAIDANIAHLASDLLLQADPLIDFSQYGGLILFHAGSGQESDISGIRSEQIWSTFLTRKLLQATFDPENDDYPGLTTDDGAILTNIVIIPESEYQDYFPGEDHPDADAYLFSIYGVLAHQFGHLIGLPTLFDNDSSNGVSQGIGNFGLMGTGVWNASGYVPAQVSPWCRYFLGWEIPITITADTQNILVDYFLDHGVDKNRLYKVPISDAEYFLVENRQQNPDGSLDPYSNLPSFTFKLLPEGEQDYYENYPLLPYFNFMENRYIGCEWDFFLPGLGGPIPPGMQIPVDGSGLLIWHIDENVIAANFTTNFDRNRINGDARHKGVDVEEADGIQHLDSAVYDYYKWGGPYDTFRSGNNDYFGNQTHNGMLSLPTAESYYGGVQLEIYDIGPSANQMSFSVRFAWRLETDYSGTNPFGACLVDFTGDGETEIFYPMPDGQLFLWKDEQLLPDFPLNRMPVTQHYVWNGEKFFIPMQVADVARLYRLGPGEHVFVFSQNERVWATHPVCQSSENRLFLAINRTDSNRGELYSFDTTTESESLLNTFDDPVITNMVLFRDSLLLLTRSVNDLHTLWNLRLDDLEISSRPLALPADSTLVGIFKAPVLPDSQNGELIVQFRNSLYLFDHDLQPVPGFPFIHDLNSTAPLCLADVDINGTLDILVSSDHGFAVIDYSGTRMSPAALNLAASDSLAFSGGIMAQDIDHDGRMEFIGSFSNNRLLVWEDDFRPKRGFPVSFSDPSRSLPLIGKASDGNIYAWIATDNGRIYRHPLPEANLGDLDLQWFTEYGTLQRQASRDHTDLPNLYLSSSIFVPEEVYIFPNPLKSIYEKRLTLNVMTSEDTPFEFRIFDIAGKLVYQQKSFAYAYLRNRELVDFPVDKLSSGVYIAVICADRESKRIKFAIEK